MSNKGILGRVWGFVFHPITRLKTDFPWDLGKSARVYGLALLIYFVVTLLSGVAVVGAVLLTSIFDQSLPERIIREHYLPFLVISSLISFVAGFGAEVWYLRRQLGKDKLKFKDMLAFNLDSLGGSAWAAIWRGVLTWGLILAADQLAGLLPLPAAHDPAAEFLKSLAGWPLLVMALLVVIGPIFEEIVFRGFLYKMTLSSLLRKGTVGSTTANFIAIAVSSLAFAALHLNLSGMVAYFVAGAILAESYRRSGSLYVPIVAHCLNNLTAVILLLVA